jgi:putative phosphoesterase
MWQVQAPIALIADIHGNGRALELALDDIRNSGIQRIVCLGDVAAMGPNPVEVVRTIRELGCPVVMGNADAFLLNGRSASLRELSPEIKNINAWCAEQLSRDDMYYIGTFYRTVSVRLGGGKTLLCYHGSPRSFHDIITSTTPDTDLDAIMTDGDADVFAGGHTHVQMYRRHGTAIVVNPGSVGMALDPPVPGDNARILPHVEYAVMDPSTLSVAFKRLPYDTTVIADAVEASGMPHATWLAAKWRRS